MVKLGEVCSIERGGSPRPIKDYITDSQEGLNWIKIGDTDPQGKYIYRTNEKIKPEGLKKTKWVEENDLLLSNSMSYGRPYILKTNGCIHDGWLVIRDYQSSLNTDFFYYLLLSPIVQRQFLLKAQGSTVSNLNTQRVTDVNVLVPPLEEQHRIVSILDASFEKIDALKKNAEENLKNAKALFQQVLAQELKPKEGWVKKKLGEIYDVRDGTHDSPKYHSEGYPLVTSKNLKENGLDLSNVKYIKEEDFHAINTRSKVNIGDILFAMIGTIGNPVIVREEPNYAIKNMALFKVDNNNSSDFLRYYLLLSIEKMRKESNGTTQKFVSLNYLRNFGISLPSLTEQHRIVSTLDTLSEKCRRLEQVAQQTIRECDALKQSILRQAFSGEL